MVLTTLIGFAGVYGILAVVDVFLLAKFIRIVPDPERKDPGPDDGLGLAHALES